jgi:hypothetical protein
MKRTMTGICVAAAFGCIATLGAQTTPTSTTSGQRAPMADKAKDVTITGCLAKSADGKFTLTNAKMDNPTSSPSAGSTSTTTAGTPPAGTTADTTPSPAGAATAWMLAGGTDLDKHVGHKIQVTGRPAFDTAMDHSRTPDPTTSTTGTTTGTVGTTGATTTATTEDQRKSGRADQPRLEVQSVKMIAPSCS